MTEQSLLLTDLYELSMLEAYAAHGMAETAVFELFVRKLPSGRGFLMAAGLEQVGQFLETLRGIGRKHGSPPRRAAAITTAEVRKLCRASGPDLAGARDQAIFLLGFAGALRRSELVGLDVERVTWIRDGLKLLIERSKTDSQGEGAIPRGRADDTCPVTALKTWLELSEISAGPLFRKVNRGGVVERARLTTDAVRQILLKRAAKAGLKGTLAEPFSPHGLRAGFITITYRNGVADEEIMGHTRHRSLTTMRSYIRRAKLSRESPAGKLGL
jgi:integrase